MVVLAHRNQITYLRRKARKVHPNEMYALLLGKRVGPNRIEIHKIVYPKLTVSTPKEVDTDEYSIDAMYDLAKELGLEVVGSIHSHTGHCAPIYLSPFDLAGHRDNGDVISGICEVTDKRTFIAFWRDNTPLPCDWEYFDKYKTS